MKSQMTDLALAAKWGRLGASGLMGAGWEAGAASRFWSERIEASAARPKPEPVRLRNARRSARVGVAMWWLVVMLRATLFDVNELVQSEQGLAERGQGSFAGVVTGLVFDECGCFGQLVRGGRA